MAFTKDWWVSSLTRTVRTMAQTAIGVIGGSFILSEVNWPVVLSASALSGLVCMLMAIAGLPEVDNMKKVNLGETK